MWPLLQALGFGVVLWFVTRPPRQPPETAEPVAAAPEPHDDPDIVIHRSIEAPQVPGMPDVERLLDTTARAYRSDAVEQDLLLYEDSPHFGARRTAGPGSPWRVTVSRPDAELGENWPAWVSELEKGLTPEMENALGRAHDGCVGWLAGKFLDRLERQAAFHLF
jgi:hypothetical protein